MGGQSRRIRVSGVLGVWGERTLGVFFFFFNASDWFGSIRCRNLILNYMCTHTPRIRKLRRVPTRFIIR